MWVSVRGWVCCGQFDEVGCCVDSADAEIVCSVCVLCDAGNLCLVLRLIWVVATCVWSCVLFGLRWA